VRPKTYTFYECAVRNWILPYLGPSAICKLTPTKIQELLNDRQTAGLAPKTVRHVHRTLTTALGVAERFGYVPRNVARLVDPVHVPKPAIRFLTVEQARLFLAEAAQDRLFSLFTLTLGLGLRLGEALGLRWQDVEPEKGRLTVRYALQRVKAPGEKQRKPVLVEPKSESSRRTVKLPAIAIHALQQHRAFQEQEHVFSAERWKGNPWNLVFTTSVGTALNERNVLRSFQSVLKRARLPRMRIHDLRHSAAAILIAQGLHAKAVAELLGHSSVSFTLQVYGHLMDEAKQQTADVMDAALNPVATSVATFEAPLRVN
jgi:integrase